MYISSRNIYRVSFWWLYSNELGCEKTNEVYCLPAIQPTATRRLYPPVPSSLAPSASWCPRRPYNFRLHIYADPSGSVESKFCNPGLSNVVLDPSMCGNRPDCAIELDCEKWRG